MSEYPQKAGSSTATTRGYMVFARHTSDHPVKLGDQIFDNRWRRVNFKEGEFGVPIACAYNMPDFAKHGLLGYSAAQALRWWFQASADVHFDGMCLETKLVEHELITTHECNAVSEHCLIGGEDRTNCLPDWGKPKDPNKEG